MKFGLTLRAPAGFRAGVGKGRNDSPTPDEFGPPAPLLRTGGKKLDLVPSDDPPRARGGLCLHFLKSTRSPLHQYKGRPEKMF
ncbi:hypothetical protein POTOM_060177 (mitochondrion) [Populus tomentosa]|uniref:Uncharacterized protein n=1 Tax=Populus tomentosa TaxID=118781 RepID=A0A8X7XTP4_POPTO|nr:hypothetical protein POTOM_060177 [Populus tomentosa]